MTRSIWKGPFVDGYLLKKAEAAHAAGRHEVIKTWSRRSTILPDFVGLTFGVHNGKKFIPVLVTENMGGQCPRRRRRQLHHRARQDPGRRGRERLRQIHAGPLRPSSHRAHQRRGDL